MASIFTYTNCKKLIEAGRCKKADKKADILNKLDVFLLNDRITQEQYEELVALINTQEMKK